MTRPTNPYKVYRKNEKSSVILETTHLSSEKVLTAPTSLYYRVDDISNNREVLDWTEVTTPSSTNEITITKAQNALYSRARDIELRQVATRAVDAAGNESYDVHYYSLSRIFTSDDQAS